MSIVIAVLLLLLAVGCVSDSRAVSYPSRIIVLAVVLIYLTGCATVETGGRRVGSDVGDVVHSVPQAVGQVAGAAVFGGTVTMNPDPGHYLEESVNREGRAIYTDAQLGVQKLVEDAIRSIFAK